jgi:phage terminase large subunit
VVDEAEEWTSETDFDKIMLSIRQKGIQNRIIIIMNPTNSNHFVYKKYIEHTHKLVEIDGVQVQISTHPNVLHIHTTYLDNVENLSDQFIREVRQIKVDNPEKYAHTVVGRWADVAEGAIFKKYGIVKEFPKWCKKVAIGLDFGFTHDPSAAVRCGIIDNALYLDELFYETGMLSSHISNRLKPYGLKVFADSQDPRLIQEIRNRGINIYPVDKFSGSVKAGIDKMKDMELFVTERSYNLLKELRLYVWDKDKDGNYINEPVDDNNHLIDGVRYYTLGCLLGKILKPKDYTGVFH